MEPDKCILETFMLNFKRTLHYRFYCVMLHFWRFPLDAFLSFSLCNVTFCYRNFNGMFFYRLHYVMECLGCLFTVTPPYHLFVAVDICTLDGELIRACDQTFFRSRPITWTGRHLVPVK
jgi:hypothetical protein